MAIYTVSSSSEFATALKSVVDGDSIKLAAGDYSGIKIDNINKGNITITSADPENPAALHDLLIRNSSGITLSHVQLEELVPGKLFGFQVVKSNGVVIDSVDVTGPQIGNGLEVSSLMIRLSNNVTVKNSEFSELGNALSILDNTNMTVENNYFHDIRADGVHGGGNSNLVISGNVFTDFYPAPGDHPDAIQLWTTHTKASTSNISITDNLFVRGEGGPVQGIFMYDDVGGLPFYNVNITGNAIIGGMFNGIMAQNVIGGSIADNVVVGTADQKSWIRTGGNTDFTVTDNTATDYIIIEKVGVTETGNQKLAYAKTAGETALKGWFGDSLDLGTDGAKSLVTFDAYVALGASVPEPVAVAPEPVAAEPAPTPEPVVVAPVPEPVAVVPEPAPVAAPAPAPVAEPAPVVAEPAPVVEAAPAAPELVVAAPAPEPVLVTPAPVPAPAPAPVVVAPAPIVVAPEPVVNRSAVSGGAGNDDLRANYGNKDGSALNGGDGNDTLRGGSFSDILSGGAGNDQMFGGRGADTFQFSSAGLKNGTVDRIYDLSFAEGDELDLSGFGKLFGGDGAAVVDSMDALAQLVEDAKGTLTATKRGATDTLVLDINLDGNHQIVEISNAYTQFAAAL